MKKEVKFRFSGHETFPCRYAWLPKAVYALKKNPEIFSNEDDAMVEFGVGKNMVRAIRFWAQVTGVATPQATKGLNVTPFGHDLLGENGHDPFLEDNQTLWLFHWNLSTQFERPLFAWDYLLNRWHEPEFTRSAILRVFEQEVSSSHDGRLSPTTLAHHLDIFIHTYVPTRGPKDKVKEDNLDCPLVELELIQRIGDRQTGDMSGKREPVFAFRHDPKPEIGLGLFVYCIFDFFARKHRAESTLSFRELSIGHGSPGQVFKLPENEIHDRCESLSHYTNGLLTFEESTSIQQVRKHHSPSLRELLRNIYSRELIHA